MTITFFDIPSTNPGNAWSPNPWKARFCLNLKGVAYKNEWVEYPDIAGKWKELGIPPSSTSADGTPQYTAPAIYDSATGKYISDSFLIAEYLEKTYPQSPSLFPGNSLGVQAAFEDAFFGLFEPMTAFLLPATHAKLNPASQAYFRRTREAAFGVTLEEYVPKGEKAAAVWAGFEEAMAKVDGWYAKSGGPFLMGSAVSWADAVVAAWLIWIRIIYGQESEEWKRIASWNGGRWAGLLDSLKPYQTV